MGDDKLFGLVWPPSALGLQERRRAQAIVRRTRALALLLANVVFLWIPVDFLFFDRPTATRLCALRVAATLVLLVLAACCRSEPASRGGARRRTVALFATGALLYVSSLQILDGRAMGPIATTIANAYSFMPFVMAAGVAAFPLAVAEAAALLLVSLAAQAWALQWHLGETPFITAEALWLQLLIGGVAAFAALSQLHLMATLVEQAIRDPLTGCHRHESGRELLEIQFRIARREGAPLALLFADLDHFKQVNDELGHEAGDHVLAAAAASLRGALRRSDLLLRWGGEEFVMVLPNTGLAEAVRLADRILAHPVCRRPDGKPITLSVGIAERKHDGTDDAEALVELADRRMYLAKQGGRNRCVHEAPASAVALPA